MKRMIILAGIMLAPLCFHQAFAQEPVFVGGPDAELAGWSGFAPHRAMSHFGTGTMAAGAEHFDLPSHNYGTWYRPKKHEIERYRRCQPTRWRPRGHGNLFVRRDTGYRMDYASYRLTDPRTDYGPAYYPVAPDETCACHDGKQCSKCSSGSGLTAIAPCNKPNCQSCLAKKQCSGCNKCRPAQAHRCNTIGCGKLHTCSSCKLLK